MLKEFLKYILPANIVEFLFIMYPNERARNVGKYYAEQIEKLPIEDAGVTSDGYAYVKLMDDYIFYSFKISNEIESVAYKYLSKRIKKQLPKACIRCAMDIVGRYWYPHMFPNAKPDYDISIRRYFHPNHVDTIDDFEIPDVEKKNLIALYELKQGDIILDVGAHTGIGAMAATKIIGDKGKVICFEADSQSFEILEKNIKDNNIKNIIPINKPVWKEKKELTFKKYRFEQNSLVNNIITKKRNEETVEADSIDNMLQAMKIENVDYINFTVNGAELEALLGCEKTLSTNPKIRLNLAGWYKLEGVRIADSVIPTLRKFNLKYAIGPLGKVLAWKNQ